MDNWLIEHTVDLTRGVETSIVWPTALMLVGDAQAHTWRVRVMRAGAPEAVTGMVAGLFERADGHTVYLQGSAAGNVAQVTLAQQCYAIPGPLKALMRVSDAGGKVVSLIMVMFRVAHGVSDSLVDPGDVIPSLDQLLAKMAAMEAATAAGNAAASAANAAAGAANVAAGAANTAAANANNAAAGATAATAKWATVSVDVDMLPPDGTAAGSVTQTATSTTIHLDLPQGRVTNATLYVNDGTTELIQRMPVIPEVGIDYAMDTDTTELYQRVHGY